MAVSEFWTNFLIIICLISMFLRNVVEPINYGWFNGSLAVLTQFIIEHGMSSNNNLAILAQTSLTIL